MRNPISTRKEYKTVKTTKEVEDFETRAFDVEYKKCGCCNQEWDVDGDVEVYTFHRRPRAREHTFNYKDLNEFIDAGYKSITQAEASHKGVHADLGIPIRKQFHETIGKEQRVRASANGSRGPIGSELEELHNAEPETVVDRKAATLYAFSYSLELPVSSLEKKNLCEFCYESIFF